MKLLSEFLLVTVWKCSFLFILRSFRLLFFHHFLYPSQNTSANSSILLCEADKPLSERLKISPGEHVDYIPAQLLRKVKNLYTSYILNHILYIHVLISYNVQFIWNSIFNWITCRIKFLFILWELPSKSTKFHCNIHLHTCSCMQNMYTISSKHICFTYLVVIDIVCRICKKICASQNWTWCCKSPTGN